MPKTLLLADDSVVIQKLVGLSFANEDVQLVTTDNGDDAIGKARECRPDIVLADVVMPGRSGYEVCEAIKSDPELAHVPVILLTGTFEAFDESRARAAGSNGHITKPFEAQALVDRVNELLSAAPPAATPELETFDGFAIAEPAVPERLSAEGGFGVATENAGPPPLTDTDLLSAPLVMPEPDDGGFGDGEHTVAMLPDIAEDDLFATADTAAAMGADMPFEATDATPLIEDPITVPQPILDASDPLGAPASFDASAHLEQPGDPSPTTVIMSEGDRSSDDISFAEPIGPVHSLDHEAVHQDSGHTMRAGDLFSQPVGHEESDSGFDFGTAETPAPVDAGPEPIDDIALSEGLLGKPIRLDDEAPAPEPVHTQLVSPADEAGGGTASTGPDITPVMRDRIHDTLERVAWEALADLNETLVKQVLERVEAIAWEVIPQMAEVLVKEEIRRMKDQDE